MDGSTLACPSTDGSVPFDRSRFRFEVEHDRCPLSGCGLVPFERAESRAASGAASATVGRCDPASGGCGSEWAPFAVEEVAWWGRDVVVDFSDDDSAEE